ncbi:hypothetical protein [Lyngbya aestuarii]|uniref:hypothetical protein n=1 Tax=Lyngbya aestuarii TaxID=118322 RepID=UPI00403E0D5A
MKRYINRRQFILATAAALTAVSCSQLGRNRSSNSTKQSLARYSEIDKSSWHADILQWDSWPIDLQFLNEGEKPAGKHGFLQTQNEQLVFEDGTVAKFWGANVQAYALYKSKKEDIVNQARRLAALGYNLVRLHHHDSSWVSPNIFDTSNGTTSQLNPESLDMLDWWVKSLKDEGIYVWLDLHVGRQFQAGDQIEGFEELSDYKGEGKGFNFVNPRLEELMQQFAEQYLTHVNNYTKLAYTQEPAVMGVLITNENDITHHFGNLMLPDKGNQTHQQMFEALAKSFAKSKNLSLPEILRTWEPGASKIVLNEIEQKFFRRAIDQLRSLGLKVPIAVSNYWGGMGLYSLPALTLGDVIDVHSYGDAEHLSTNPRQEANFIPWIGAAQVYGKPLTITEWNVEYPKRDRFTAPLYLAAMACLQGWDAPMIYGYQQSPIGQPKAPESWSTSFDPAITAIMPAAAILYRQKHVKEAQQTYCLKLDSRETYYKNINPDNSATIRTLVEQSKLTVSLPDIKELDWDNNPEPDPNQVTIVTEIDQDFIPRGQQYVESDTGELRRDWVKGIFTINTDKTQAASGWIGEEDIALRDVKITMVTPKCTVAVTSLDNLPIAQSKRLLLTTVAQVVPSSDDALPYLSEPTVGTIEIQSNGSPWRVVPLAPDGSELTALPSEQQGNTLRVILDGKVPTHWFILQS